MRASSVAMCSTWVWATSVLLRGLPLLFLSVSLLYVLDGFLKFGFLLYICSGKVPAGLGFLNNMLTRCQTLNSENGI